jgi:hypothetical protein
MNNSEEIRLFVKILFTPRYQALAEVVYFRNDMTVEFYQRWKWYFEYRAALIKVQNAKSIVTIQQGSYPYILPKDELIKKLESKIRSKKAKIVEFENKLQNAVNKWDELYPIEQHPLWSRVIEKKSAYYSELKNLEQELKVIKNNNNQ